MPDADHTIMAADNNILPNVLSRLLGMRRLQPFVLVVLTRSHGLLHLISINTLAGLFLSRPYITVDRLC